MAKIEYLIEVTTSSRDTNGNCYHYACITRTSDGESISGMVGGASNPSAHLGELGIDWENKKMIESVIPIRQFNHLVKGVNHYLDMPALEKFTGVPVWHITEDGKNTLCNSKSDRRIHISNYHPTIQQLDKGVWCSNCRRANYYNQTRKAG